MPFGAGFSIRLTRPSMRQKILNDMQSVAEGRMGSRYNSNLIQTVSNIPTNVKSITRSDGYFIATVGETKVGSTTDKIGAVEVFTVGGQ